MGDTIPFSGGATDQQDGTIPASGLSWTLIVHHCPTSPTNCHTHTIQTIPGVSSGSFTAPDHGYPSSLEIQLTATDSSGLQATTSVNLNPKTVVLSFATVPTGLQLAVNSTASTAPFTRDGRPGLAQHDLGDDAADPGWHHVQLAELVRRGRCSRTT